MDKPVLDGIKRFSETKDVTEKRNLAVKMIAQLLPKALRCVLRSGHRKEIDDYLREFLKYEELLYSTQGFYRDHLAHALRVFCLGEILLYESDVAKLIAIREELIEPAWCIAALFHDFGYPLETERRITGSIEKMLSKIKGLRFHSSEISFEVPTIMLFETFLRELSKANMIYFYGLIERIKSEGIGFAELMRSPLWAIPAIGRKPTLPLYAHVPWSPPTEEQRWGTTEDQLLTIRTTIEGLDGQLRTMREKLDHSEKRTSSLERLGELISTDSIIIWEVYSRLLKGLNERQHGVIIALIFLQLLESELSLRFSRLHRLAKAERAPPILDSLYKVDLMIEVALAMAMHNLELDDSYQISFGSRPLAFILALCDELQEWGRPVRTAGFFSPPASLFDGIGFEVNKKNGKPQVVFEFDFKSSRISEFPHFSEWEFYETKVCRLRRLDAEGKIDARVVVVPSKSKERERWEIITCPRCGAFCPSHKLFKKDIVKAVHRCKKAPQE